MVQGRESLREGYSQEPKLALVVRGVLALDRAVHDMRSALCPPSSRELCPDMLPFNLSLYQVCVTFLINTSRRSYLLISLYSAELFIASQVPSSGRRTRRIRPERRSTARVSSESPMMR